MACAKCKLCRREGTKLFLKGEKCFGSKCPVVRRNYPPGAHGPTQTFKKTLMGFARQLREKQKAKRIYGLREHQFSNYVEVARKREGDAGVLLKQLLEMRLDNVMFRAGFATSRAHAHQLVGHGLVLLNGKKNDIPSYQVKIGDTLQFRERVLKSKNGEDTTKRLEKHVAPSWLTVDAQKMEIKVVNKPVEADMELIFNTKPIIEYYSR
jgi:small subunit ribosomal protein S4